MLAERVNEGRGDFAVIFDSESTSADVATCRGGETVHETAVRFGDGDEAFFRLGQRQVEQESSQKSDTSAEDLARANASVMSRALGEEVSEGGRHFFVHGRHGLHGRTRISFLKFP